MFAGHRAAFGSTHETLPRSLTLALALVTVSIAVRAETVTGTAAFQQIEALPPTAVFEARVEDISRVGAAAS